MTFGSFSVGTREASTALQNRDTFQRNTGFLQQQQGTRPLKSPGTKPLISPDDVKVQLEGLMSKGAGTMKNLEPRMELLIRASQIIPLPLPGVEIATFKHPVSPKGEQIITYLCETLKKNAVLARQVQVGVFRYQEAEKAMASAQSALDKGISRVDLLEELKLKLFYMTRIHEDFKGDPVLAQLFPAPQTVTANKGGAPQSTVDRLKAKQERQALMIKAEVLASNLAPKMAIIKMTLENLDAPKGLNLGAFFTPETRQARMLAMGLGGQKALIDQLRQAHELFLKLQQALPEARKSEDLEPLKQIIFPLSQLTVECQKHAMLKDLFPLGDQAQFPDQAPPEGQ